MDIESNFNQNLKSSVKKNSSKLPASNKFLLHSLLKNLDEVEGMLDDDTLVEYNVGDIKSAVKKQLKETNLHQNSTNYGMYSGVEKAYNFESQGPLGVSYYEGEEEEVEDILERRQLVTEKKLGGKCKQKFGSESQGYTRIPGVWSIDKWDRWTCSTGGYDRGRTGRPSTDYGYEELYDVLNEAKDCGYSFDCPGDKICKKGKCRKCKECKGKTLKGNQNKLDMNKNGKLDSEDFKMLGKKQETKEATTTSSSGAYSTPRFWAKEWKKHNTKKKKISKKKSSKRKSSHNNKRWMPGSQFVKVKDKCRTFPYCNQGDITALELWEKKIMSEAAKNVSKKTGVSEKGVRKMVEKELGEIIRRAFYKSPITDLVGTGNMDTPIGKIFTMNSNSGSKHES